MAARHGWVPWAAYAAALWALIFGVFHVIWAAGWYVGLDPEQARIAFAKTPFLVYDLVVAGMCAIAVLVAFAFVQPWGQRLPRKLLRVIAWSGTSLLALRACGGLIQTVYLVVTGQFSWELRIVLGELWFYLGAALWGFSVWRFKLRGEK